MIVIYHRHTLTFCICGRYSDCCIQLKQIHFFYIWNQSFHWIFHWTLERLLFYYVNPIEYITSFPKQHNIDIAIENVFVQKDQLFHLTCFENKTLNWSWCPVDGEITLGQFAQQRILILKNPSVDLGSPSCIWQSQDILVMLSTIELWTH